MIGENKMEKIQFENYVMMIRKMAHKYSNVLNVPYEEMEAQGYLIYCECLKTFDISKNVSFGTHLFVQLKRLNDFGHTYNRQKGILLEDMIDSQYSSFRKSRCYANQIVKNKFESDPESKMKYELVSPEESITAKDVLECAKEVLSIEAYNLMNWIIHWDWDDGIHSKPNIAMAMEKFGMKRNQMTKLWLECSSFWNSKGYALYC